MRRSKFLVLTYGTRGDVEPFIALGRGLVERGHSVTLCTAERFRAFVEGHAISFAPLSNASLDLIDTRDGKVMLEGAAGWLRRIGAAIRLARHSGPINEALSQEAWTVAHSVRPNVIVFHPKLMAAPHIAEALKIPAVMGLLQPIIVPTTAFPPFGMPRLPIPGYNRLAYRLVTLSYAALRKSINRLRTGTLGLEPVRRRHDVLLPRSAGTIPILHAVSPAAIQRPVDWPPHAMMTGYWFLPPAGGFEPPLDLTRFIDAGPAPVYVGFGSMTVEDAGRLLAIVVEALRLAKVRGVIATGWAGLDATGADDVMTIPAVPHEWLFPKMAAVVHHGGAGTTAQGFRAGVPCVVCPFIGDQPGWARRSIALGVGAAPVPRPRLTAERLGQSIRVATADPTLRRNAERLAAKIRDEDGVAVAAEAIEAFVRARSMQPH
ncbi:MAG: glycosyltransferase [Devosia sp.]